MKVGHSLYFYKNTDEVRNATIFRDLTAHIEGGMLLMVSVVGGVGNLLILCAPVVCSRYRTTSCAFLSHHCLLDSLKSVFCVPFACALLLDVDIPYCNAVGATYIFLMTLTAYNLLALHINEEYQLSDRRGYIPGRPDISQEPHHTKRNSFWCVSFGIFMIWFTTVLLHLGVAFLPSSAEFNYDIGNCVFNYGTPKNYVIHILWTMLVTGALLISIVCFTMFFCKLRTHMNSEKWTLLHTSMARDMQRCPELTGTRVEEGSESGHPPLADHSRILSQDTEELHYEFAEGVEEAATRQMKLCLRRVVVMLLMVISFLLFWYPLFILTLLDVHYTRPPQTYRLCMILAWSHPVTTPFFCAVIYFDMLNMTTLTRSVYSTALPMKDSTSFSSYHRDDTRHRTTHRYRSYDLGFSNENFSFSNHGSARCEGSDEDEELCCTGGDESVGEYGAQRDISAQTATLHTLAEDQEHRVFPHPCRSGQGRYQTLIM